MRTLSATLTSNQSAVGVDGRPQTPIWRIVLTRAGQSTKTYTKTRVVRISGHIEEEDNQVATVLLDNSDGTLTSLDFEMYKGVISYGYTDPTNGDEYSPCAPLYVLGQRFYSAQGALVCQLNLIGIPNLMAMDKAESELTLTDGDARTVKALLTAVADASLPPYTNYTNYTVTYDSEDNVIDALKPKDSFNIGINENRWSKVSQLLGWTGNKIRAEDDGNLHTFNPTTTGSTYDYEYKLAVSGEHTFFNKELRNRFVNPNKVVVESHEAHDPQYTGNATSATSFALFPKTETIRLRLPSDTLAASIASARIKAYELNAEKGSVNVPMNVGQEVWDYIKVTDSRQNDSREGNVRYIQRNVEVTRNGLVWEMEIRFGKTVVLPSPIFFGESGQRVDIANLSATINALINAYNSLDTSVRALLENQSQIIDHLNSHHEVFLTKDLTGTDVMTIPSE